MREQVKFQVFINGVPYGAPQPTKFLAEALLNNLTSDQRVLAEVKQLTSEGLQMLFE